MINQRLFRAWRLLDLSYHVDGWHVQAVSFSASLHSSPHPGAFGGILVSLSAPAGTPRVSPPRKALQLRAQRVPFRESSVPSEAASRGPAGVHPPGGALAFRVGSRLCTCCNPDRPAGRPGAGGQWPGVGHGRRRLAAQGLGRMSYGKGEKVAKRVGIPIRSSSAIRTR